MMMYRKALIGSVLLLSVALLAHAQAPETPTEKKPAQAPEVARDTVTVIFGTEPKRARAYVFYGKEKLGRTPFEYEFKKDSGPVDLVYKSDGYMKVNTRVYTFSDSKLIVKMTKEEDKSTLYGYREEIPPDAGVPTPIEAATPTSVPTSAPSPSPPSPPSPPQTP